MTEEISRRKAMKVLGGFVAGVLGAYGLGRLTEEERTEKNIPYRGWTPDEGNKILVFYDKPVEGEPIKSLKGIGDPEKFDLEGNIGKRYDVKVRRNIYSRIGISDEVIVDVKLSALEQIRK